MDRCELLVLGLYSDGLIGRVMTRESPNLPRACVLRHFILHRPPSALPSHVRMHVPVFAHTSPLHAWGFLRALVSSFAKYYALRRAYSALHACMHVSACSFLHGAVGRESCLTSSGF